MKRFTKRSLRTSLSAKSKLTLILLVVTLAAIGIVGYLGWSSSQKALNDAILNQLTSARASKARQIESYFQNLQNQAKSLNGDGMVIEAMVRFNKAYRKLNQAPVPEELGTEIEAYYQDEFFPGLTAANISGAPEYNNYKPDSQAAEHLQYQYIVRENNVLPDLEGVKDYEKFHQEYHDRLSELTRKFGYYDLFLIDAETGAIVYSVSKETEYATNLMTGPYRNTGLAKVVKKVQDSSSQAVQFVDFDVYEPSYGALAAFIAEPIKNGDHVVGILALQLSVDEINRIMTGDENWENDGLGQTGETYLVGHDRLMRSNSRFLLQDIEEYLQDLKNAGVSQVRTDLIKKLNTSILLQDVNTKGADAAISGQTGIISPDPIIKGYRGIDVLSSFAPLNIEGLNWVILSEMDAKEAFAPVNELWRNIFISTVILVVIISFLSILLTANFMQPVAILIDGARRMGKGEDIEININSRDEFGELADTFNTMMKGVREQNALVKARNQEFTELLLGTLPRSVAKRFSNGERQILDSTKRASVLVATIRGYTDLLLDLDEEEILEFLHELDDNLHTASERHDVELFKLIGQQYVAVCGLTSPHLDHARRIVDFSQAMLSAIEHFNLSHESHISIKIGIDSGKLRGGIIGTRKFTYDLWGTTVPVAQETSDVAKPNTIYVTQDVYDQVQQLYEFSKRASTVVERSGQMATWRLETSSQLHVTEMVTKTKDKFIDLPQS